VLCVCRFTDYDVYDFGRCCAYGGGKYNCLFGRDECLLAGLAMGADGFIGSTYNLPFIGVSACVSVRVGG
jgi:N-acetylneuraminate lyase